MADAFSTRSDAVFAPARRLVAVTPNDSTDLTDLPKALHIGDGGYLDVIPRAVDDATLQRLVAAMPT